VFLSSGNGKGQAKHVVDEGARKIAVLPHNLSSKLSDHMKIGGNLQ